MTRRERHERIISAFPVEQQHYYRNVMSSIGGLSVFTDEAIRKLASDLVRSYRLQQKLNRENRARRRA